MSILSRGYGATPSPLLLMQGYVPALPLRETFTVPTPDGAEAQRTTPGRAAASLGSLETAIAFGLSFAPWLSFGETLSSVAATVRGLPLAGPADVDATTTVLQAARPMASLVVVVLHAAQAHTSYVVTASVQTSAGRTLQCRMPPIWCPA